MHGEVLAGTEEEQQNASMEALEVHMEHAEPELTTVTTMNQALQAALQHKNLSQVPRTESRIVQTLFSLQGEDMRQLCDNHRDSDNSSFSTIGSATGSDVSLSSLMEAHEDSRSGEVREALTHTTSLLYPEGMPCNRQGEAKVRGTIKALVMQPRLQVTRIIIVVTRKLGQTATRSGGCFARGCIVCSSLLVIRFHWTKQTNKKLCRSVTVEP
eukprot:COSAG01_NODE_15_length_40797_cov_245.690550_17_plen_213_part_00